ncbi:GAF and ANTAR domain-containing protein [Kibdelosporangium phytohabitans]|uniref:Transcriptional regulator n=1 Tax=Kibdelosporangium phytohabitans TaxID=860235 RepID=A0A0N9HLD7_9PSEU|nr:GAF and ANTAR domain-containing protein [Kibdelosporangium phytohabitans]ALG06988.1 transcriptional regulator [Kibdelosporangium phytohabitans]MBE1468273.1 GAF domain-containing protein [Kibdelosporangium phytohabitans]
MPNTSDTAIGQAVRQQRVSRTFVALADTLVTDFDIADALHMLVERVVELLSVSAAGVILVAPDGSLEVMASSTQRAELLELFAVQTEDGPCVDCVRTGSPVNCADIPDKGQQWPRFAAAAQECGFRAVHAVPMRLRHQVIGVLTLLNTETGVLHDEDLQLGQALADIATIAILQHRAIEHSERVTGQLQSALDTRIVIEQAKGILAERGAVTPDEAFGRLRAHARAHQQRMTDLSRAVIAGTADLRELSAQAPAPHRTDRRGAEEQHDADDS